MMINFREPSTKRAIVWIIGGGVVLVQIIRGQAVDADAILNRIDTWIGVAMTIAGLFGLLPDAPVEKPKDALPPIELQAKPTVPPACDCDPGGVRCDDPEVCPARQPESKPTAAVGWGDK